MKVHVFLVVMAALGFSIFGMTQPSSREALKRPKWEYKVVAFEGSRCSSDGQIADSLLALGQLGWELVSYTRGMPALPQDAEGTLSIAPAATGPGRDVNPPTANSFQGGISMKMGQTPPENCVMILKRELLPPVTH